MAGQGDELGDLVWGELAEADGEGLLASHHGPAGKVPVAVTYEPYLTTAMKQNAKVKRIYAASVEPGLISDVLVVLGVGLLAHLDPPSGRHEVRASIARRIGNRKIPCAAWRDGWHGHM